MISVNANGANIPALGFGTWTLKGDQCVDMVSRAIDAGYRHIDTAAMYENEEAVGKGITNSGLDRDELFVVTKIWHTNIGKGDMERSLEASLKRLGLDQVDLALIHWPSKIVPIEESTAALNDLKSKGLTRNIGVSNHTIPMIEQVVKLSEHPIACNQIEYHPYLDQSRVMEACRKHGIARTAYCPLNRAGELFKEPAIERAASRLGKTPAQIVLRWHVQQPDSIAIPRTSNPDRISENFSIFDFELNEDEMNAISAMTKRNLRQCDYEFSPDWD